MAAFALARPHLRAAGASLRDTRDCGCGALFFKSQRRVSSLLPQSPLSAGPGSGEEAACVFYIAGTISPTVGRGTLFCSLPAQSACGLCVAAANRVPQGISPTSSSDSIRYNVGSMSTAAGRRHFPEEFAQPADLGTDYFAKQSAAEVERMFPAMVRASTPLAASSMADSGIPIGEPSIFSISRAPRRPPAVTCRDSMVKGPDWRDLDRHHNMS